MFHSIVWLFFTVIPISHVWGDATTTWDNCYDINLNTGIPGVPRVPVLQPCLHVALDTCGDMSLHAAITVASNTLQFNISSTSTVGACAPLPSPYSTICQRLCLQVDPSTFRITHSYAYFKPYVQLQGGSFCPGTRFPTNPQGYSLGVDCDAQANTSCETCTSASDQGICAWCPTTGACVATSSVSTTLCNGVAMCPNDVQHLGFCSSQGNGTITPSTAAPAGSTAGPSPTYVPTTVAPTPTPSLGPTVAPGGSCANPMFAGELQVTRSRLRLLSTPAVVVNASCPDLAGQPQCCAKDTFNQWKQMMQNFDQGAIIASKDKGNIKLEDLIRLLNEDQLLPNFTTPTSGELVQLNKLLEIFKQLDAPLQTCTKAIVAYWNGLMCFACHTDWRTYYNPDTKELSLSKSTCDAADAGCSPVLRLINSRKWDLIRIFINLYTLSGDHTYDNIKNAMQTALDWVTRYPTFDQDICAVGWKGASTCRQVVCEQFLHGLDYNFSLPNLNTGPYSTHVMHTSSSSPRSPSGLVNPVDLLLPSLTAASTSHIQSIFRYLLFITQHINTLHNSDVTLITTEQVGQQPTIAPTGGHAINKYVEAGGYDVNLVGCTAQMSTQACTPPTPAPSSPSSSSDAKSNLGLIIGILVAIAIGALAIYGLFWYIRKRRSTTRVPPNRRLQDEDFGTGVTSPDGSAYSRFDPRL